MYSLSVGHSVIRVPSPLLYVLLEVVPFLLGLTATYKRTYIRIFVCEAIIGFSYILELIISYFACNSFADYSLCG